MRGKGYTTAAESEENRITPAYAGKRWEGLKMAQDFEDHPRLCGEKPCSKIFVKGVSGSPPPMRGKDHPQTGSRTCRRITPAYAGKRPRGGGTPPDPPGSPPPMRGKGMT